jgi:hypothetical protein
MPVIVGIAVAVVVAAFARLVGFDRDRAFYPVVLVVIAAYYLLFAAMGGGPADLAAEIPAFLVFTALAVIGFRTSLWVVVAGLALHGLFDFTRQWVMAGAGVPPWWPAFCLAADLAFAMLLAMLLRLDRRSGAR